MLPICVLLLVAGFETTVNLISNAVLALLGHPAQWQALCADPDRLAPKAVEEVLRWDPPVQRTGRIALESVELEEKPVRKGELVVTLIGAANRDPEVYDHPDTFDIMRAGAPAHLAFSSGIHYCLGQPLARLEATIALRMLAMRMPGLALDGSVKRRNATTIRGPIHLPVTAGATGTPHEPADGGLAPPAGARPAGNAAEPVTPAGNASRLALADGAAPRNSGVVNERRAYASETAARIPSSAGLGHQREYRAAEPAAHHPRTKRSRGQRRLDRGVRLRPGDLEVVPQRDVRLGEQPPDLAIGIRSVRGRGTQQGRGLEHAPVVSDDVPRAPPQDRVSKPDGVTHVR